MLTFFGNGNEIIFLLLQMCGVVFEFALFSVYAFSPSYRKDPLRNQRAHVLSWKVSSSYNSFPVSVMCFLDLDVLF